MEQPTPNFNQLKFSKEIQKIIAKAGFVSPTPIQNRSIPQIFEHNDIFGLAQTGTGKTAAYLLPLMDKIYLSIKSLLPSEKDSEPTDPKKVLFENWETGNFILILVPTRELAGQVASFFKAFTGDTNLKISTIYGGTSYGKQKAELADKPEFVVATPGRLIDLYKDHFIDLKQVRGIVFDEADRMFDMGFKTEMRYILRRIREDRLFLLFSATLNLDVLNISYEFGASPVEINVSQDEVRADHVKDSILHLGEGEKPKFLLSLLKKYQTGQVVVFSNYKNNVQRIVAFLLKNNLDALGISSLISQSQREKVIAQMKSKEKKYILVATDVAARGLDIQDIAMVINYELPNDPETYIHRIGRTGRAGSEGIAFSFSSEKDVDSLMRIHDYLKKKLDVVWLEEDEIVEKYESFPRDSDLKKSYKNHTNRDSSKTQDKYKGSKPKYKSKSKSSSSSSDDSKSRKNGPKKTYRKKTKTYESDSKSDEQGANKTRARKSSYKGKKTNSKYEDRSSQKSDTRSTSKRVTNKTRTNKTRTNNTKSSGSNEGAISKVSKFIKGIFSKKS